MLGVCLDLIERGDPDEVYDILPHIRVLRPPECFAPLVDLLKSGDSGQQAAAAAGLGSLGDPRAVPVLGELALRGGSSKAADVDPVQAAAITALGEISLADSAEFLARVYERFTHRAHGGRTAWLVLESLGQLAQQGIERAERELIRFLDHPDSGLVALAATELAFSYWHRPTKVPNDLLDRLQLLHGRGPEEIRASAAAALLSLARLGSAEAARRLRACV